MLLTACITDQPIIKYVEVPCPVKEVSPTPVYNSVGWTKVGNDYCIDINNAKSLLINRQLDINYQVENNLK